MPLQPHGPAPYAPPHTVIAVIEWYRDKGPIPSLTLEVIQKLKEVSDSLAPRTLATLQLLDLTDKDGKPTPQFETLRVARGDEYRQRLREWIEAVYAEPLRFTDPSTDDPDSIAEAFRGYQPAGQRGRMVTLLLGLLAHAGAIETKPVRSRATPARPRDHSKTPSAGSRAATSTATASGLPPALKGLLEQLPGSWTKEKRAAWLAAFAAVLDITVPIEEETVDMVD